MKKLPKHLQANLSTISRNPFNYRMKSSIITFDDAPIVPKELESTKTMVKVYVVRLATIDYGRIEETKVSLKNLFSVLSKVQVLPPTQGWADVHFYNSRHVFRTKEEAQLFILLNKEEYRRHNPELLEYFMNKSPEYFI